MTTDEQYVFEYDRKTATAFLLFALRAIAIKRTARINEIDHNIHVRFLYAFFLFIAYSIANVSHNSVYFSFMSQLYYAVV